MVNPDNVIHVGQKIRETLEKLGEALDEWLTKQGLKPQPVPIPLDRPNRKRRRH